MFETPTFFGVVLFIGVWFYLDAEAWYWVYTLQVDPKLLPLF